MTTFLSSVYSSSGDPRSREKEPAFALDFFSDKFSRFLQAGYRYRTPRH
jgi:hypothetical protein